MALLVNYEGTYVEPQKLWYLIDGAWKEVQQVFESPIQNEIMLADQERIKLDKTVLGLTTKIEELQYQINGGSPTVPVLTDPALLLEAQKQLDIATLQMNVAKIEQVIATKELFEQKAQIEYKKLILQGEIALEKITTLVNNPEEWGVIRLDPQGPLDERLEVAIAHGLLTNERLFTYGSMEYRLYKLAQIEDIDNLAYLSDNFKRRLAKTDYANNTVAMNYIMTTQTIKEAIIDVNGFVNSGAQRIEDYLFSLKDQAKYILDGIAEVQDTLVQLATVQTPNIDGTFASINSKTDVNLGSLLLKSQGVTSYDALVSTQVLNEIKAGTKVATDYAGYTKINATQESLEEKIYSIQEFRETNETIQQDMVTNKISFVTLNVLSSQKVKLAPAKNLFWSSPLSDATVSKAQLPYIQGYTSSGTYVFKNDELVTLSTHYVSIISAILTHTKDVTLGVSHGTYPIRIIQVVGKNTFTIGPEVQFGISHPKIINVKANNTGNATLLNAVNEKDQHHTAIPFVKEVFTKTPDDFVDLSVYHPIINSIFYPNVYNFSFNETTKLSTEEFEYAFSISVLGYKEENKTFDFNTRATKAEYIREDNIVSFIEANEKVIQFNTYATKSEYIRTENVVSFVESSECPLSFNTTSVIPRDSSYDISKYDSAVINVIESKENTIDFNCFQFRSKPLNGYSQKTNFTVVGTIGSIPEIEIDEETIPTITYDVLSHRADLFKKTQIVITSQTGLVITDIENEIADLINVSKSTIPRILTSSGLRINIVDSDLVNIQKSDVVRVTTGTYTGTTVYQDNYDLCNLAIGINRVATAIKDDTLTTIETDSGTETYLNVNKDLESIVYNAQQLNPGIIL